MKLRMNKKDTAYQLYQECKKLFPVWCWNEEELKNIISDRSGDYEVSFADNVEADKDLKNFSANDLKKQGVIGITLPERLKLELEYFKKTGQHLDIENITLCSGSRYSDGFVPSVGWYSDEMCVGWCYPGLRSDCLRSRRAVLTSNLTLNPLYSATTEELLAEVGRRINLN